MTSSVASAVPPRITSVTREQSLSRPIRQLSRAIEKFPSNEFTTSTPAKLNTMDGVLRYHDTSGREADDSLPDLEMLPVPPPDWIKPPAWTDKYVDDITVGECLYTDSAISSFSTNREKRIIHASTCEEMFINIRSRAESIGCLLYTSDAADE